MKYLFKFVTDAGETLCIAAPSRKKAKEMFCESKGVTEDYITKHCLVKNKGVVQQ